MNIPDDYLSRAETWLIITTLAYFMMNGAQIFETAVLVPKWTANPPESFKWLADTNGTSLKTFWIIVHSLHELTFILALIFCWKLVPVRNGLLILLAFHLAVRGWTLAYFAPNIMEFEKLTTGLGNTADLVKRASLWKILNYIRVGLFILLSLGLLPLYGKIMSFKTG